MLITATSVVYQYVLVHSFNALANPVIFKSVSLVLAIAVFVRASQPMDHATFRIP